MQDKVWLFVKTKISIANPDETEDSPVITEIFIKWLIMEKMVNSPLHDLKRVKKNVGLALAAKLEDLSSFPRPHIAEGRRPLQDVLWPAQALECAQIPIDSHTACAWIYKYIIYFQNDEVKRHVYKVTMSYKFAPPHPSPLSFLSFPALPHCCPSYPVFILSNIPSSRHSILCKSSERK